MKLKIYSAIFACLIANIALAQFGLGGSLEVVDVDKKKEVEKLKEEQTLVVFLQEPDEARLKKMTEQEKQTYLAGVKENNTILKRVFQEHWTFTDEVQYMTPGEFKDLDKKKRRGYTKVVLGVNTLSDEIVENGQSVLWGTSGSFSDIGLIHDAWVATDRVVNVHLPYLSSTEADLVWAVQQMQNFMNAQLNGMDAEDYVEYSLEEYGDQLKSKTLFIDKNDLSKGMTERQLKRSYPYEVKVVSRNEIDEAIMQADAEVLVLKLLPVEVTTSSSTSMTEDPNSPGNGIYKTYETRSERTEDLFYNHLITNAEDGKIVSGHFIKTLSLGGFTSPEVDKDVLKDYIENSKGD